MDHRTVPRREITLVFGKTGMGKTTFVRELLLSIPRAIILDPLGEFDGPEFDDLTEMIDYLEANWSKGFTVRTSDVSSLNVLSSIAMQAGDLTLMVEEAQRAIPSLSKLPPMFEDVIYRGRHAGPMQDKNVNVLLVAQRPTTIHIAPRSQWSRIVSFNQTEENDVNWMRTASGFDVDEIRRLRVGEYLDIIPGEFSKKKTRVLPLSFSRGKEEKLHVETGESSIIQFLTKGEKVS